MSRQRRILVVDDDDDIRETLADVLRTESYEVSAARDGADALRQLAAGATPDLILLDLMMPVMNGYELRARLLEHPAYRAIPVIVITADGEARASLERLSPATLLMKPVKMKPLLAAVEQIGGGT